MDLVTQSLVIGLTEQAPLVLAAIGFALIYRLTGLINVAYAETRDAGCLLRHVAEHDVRPRLLRRAPADRDPHGTAVSVATYLLIFRPAKRRSVGVLEIDHHLLRPVDRSCATGSSSSSATRCVFFDVPPPDTVRVLGVGVTSFRLVALVSVGSPRARCSTSSSSGRTSGSRSAPSPATRSWPR